jgi:hypothetical protein
MKQVILVYALMLLVGACRKDPNTQVTASLKLQLKFNVDSSPMQFDTLQYLNSAGQTYSVSHLEFFISNIVLHSTQGDVASNQVFYVDARRPNTNSIQLDHLPARSYSGISCLIGLDSVHNRTGALYPSQDNNGMFWPVPMGGGYHFMKLEGRVKSADSSLGYAMHLGQNPHLVQANMLGNFQLFDNSTKVSVVAMNIDSWFDTPYVYDFFVDGRYTMAYPVLMMKLKANGADVLDLLEP